jgi:ribosomal protein S18 acetylase RimI-like enzyme
VSSGCRALFDPSGILQNVVSHENSLGRRASMQIRQYRDSDWPTVREIYDLSKPDEMRGVVDASDIPPLEADPDMTALFHNSQVLVMEDAGRVVGFAGSRGSEITWLFVHPNDRRRGVAAALIRELLDHLDGTITLNVATTNVAARNLYEHLGFTLEREFIGQFNGHSCPVSKLRYHKAA